MFFADARSRNQRQLAKVDYRRVGTPRITPILQSIPVAPVAALTSAVDGFQGVTKALFR